MRILLVTPYLPWPIDSGGNAAQYSTLQCLADDHDFTLLCPVYSEGQEASAGELARRLPSVRVRAVFCGTRPLPPRRHSPPVRLLRGLARRLRSALQNRHLSRESSTVAQPYNPFSGLPSAFVSAFNEEVAQTPDLVQCEFAETLPLVASLPAGMKRLFLAHQVHHVYLDRFFATHGATPESRSQADAMRGLETGFLRQFDDVIVFSDEDRNALASIAPASRFHVSPFPYPSDTGIAATPAPDFDGRFFFLGSEPHDPNRDGLEWLLGHIWPLIRADMPSARLEVVGKWSAGWASRSGLRNVSFPGFVPDLAPFLRGGIMLSPIRIGAGLRVKIMVALAQGVPVVSTTIGAEGLAARDGVEILLRDSPEDFAGGALILARDANLRCTLGTAAIALVRRHYSPASVRAQRNQIYAAVAARERVSPAAT